MAPPFLEQAFFVFLNQSRCEFFEGKRSVSGEFSETFNGAGVKIGGSIASGILGFFDRTLCESIYCGHNLNFKMNNVFDKQAVS